MHPKMNISWREHLFSTSVVSPRLLKTVVPKSHAGVLNLFNINGSILSQKRSQTAAILGASGVAIFPPKLNHNDKMSWKHAENELPEFQSDTSLLPGVKPANELAAQVVDSDIWEFCLRAWMQAVKTDQGIGEGRWWEGIAASEKHGLKLFLGLDRPFSNKNRGQPKNT